MSISRLLRNTTFLAGMARLGLPACSQCRVEGGALARWPPAAEFQVVGLVLRCRSLLAFARAS